MGIYEKVVDRVLNIFFSKDKTSFYLLILLLAGFILRIIAAVNLTVSADDMHFAIHAINFIGSGKLVVYDQSAGLWYELTDILYRILGVSQLTSRFAAVLFGTLSILAVFLLTKEFTNKRTGLIAAVLLAISPWHIKNSIAEMDVVAMFFILFSAFLFIRGLKEKKFARFLLAGILLGLGIYTKVYSLMFIPSFIFFGAYEWKKAEGKIDKKLYKFFFVFLFFAFIFAIPSLTHNYLLYKDKGFTDLLYARTLGIGKDKAANFYSWDAGWNSKADWIGLVFGDSENLPWSNLPTSLYALLYVFFGDPLVLVLGILGLFFLFRTNRRMFVFLILAIAFTFLYLASIVLLSKHYLFVLLFLIPGAAFFIELISRRINLKYLIILALLFNLFWAGYNNISTMGNFYSTSGIEKMMRLKKDIPQNSLILVDSRIYRGQINWMFYGKNYLEASYFPELFKASESSSGQKIPIEVYFVECELDDCGWGTVANQPEFNKSMEDMAKFFRNNSEASKVVYSAEGSKFNYPIIYNKQKPHFSIHKRTLLMNPLVLGSIKKTYTWFLYPIGYDESISGIFDKYTAYSSADQAVNSLSLAIIRLALILAAVMPVLIILLAFKEADKTENETVDNNARIQ